MKNKKPLIITIIITTIISLFGFILIIISQVNQESNVSSLGDASFDSKYELIQFSDKSGEATLYCVTPKSSDEILFSTKNWYHTEYGAFAEWGLKNNDFFVTSGDIVLLYSFNNGTWVNDYRIAVKTDEKGNTYAYLIKVPIINNVMEYEKYDIENLSEGLRKYLINLPQYYK